MKRPVMGSRYEPPTRYKHDSDMERVQKGLLNPSRGPLTVSRVDLWLIAAAAICFTLIFLSK